MRILRPTSFSRSQHANWLGPITLPRPAPCDALAAPIVIALLGLFALLLLGSHTGRTTVAARLAPQGRDEPVTLAARVDWTRRLQQQEYESHKHDIDRLQDELQSLQRQIQHQPRMQALQRDRTGVQRQLAAQRDALMGLPAKHRQQVAALEAGSGASPHSDLEAHLYVPQRALADIAVGDRVLLRYQAWPFRKYGHYHGTVRQVGDGAPDPRGVRVVVALAAQNVNVLGRKQPLQAGMTAQADVLHQRRPLYQWLLRPLYQWLLRALTPDGGNA